MSHAAFGPVRAHRTQVERGTSGFAARMVSQLPNREVIPVALVQECGDLIIGGTHGICAYIPIAAAEPTTLFATAMIRNVTSHTLLTE